MGKDIVGLNIQHGIFNSLITAGVLIDGSPQNSSSGGNIGPDGSDAIFDSQILAGVQIKNLLINGNVTSDYVTNPKPNPTGYPTRIVAGEVLENRAPGRDSQGGFPQGTFTSAGNIDNFQITGALIDSVLAASVAPYGGNGMLPYANGFSYSAPHPRRPLRAARDSTPTMLRPESSSAGLCVQHARAAFPNFSEVSYYNETEINNITTLTRPPQPLFPPPGRLLQHWHLATRPSTIPSCPARSTRASRSPPRISTRPMRIPGGPGTTTSTIKLSLPSKSTVLGGVISNPHRGPEANDFAGIFADDTRGVFVGVLPT